jgi:hypothetical protein
MNLKNLLPVPVLFSLLSCQGQQQPVAATQKIVIIRHGEKPAEGDNLSCAGFNRALQLPAVLDKKVGVVNAIFVPSLKLGKTTGAARMYQTVIPYAIRRNLYVNTKFDVDDVEGLAGGIRKINGTVLVVWEHKHIHKLLKALGIDDGEKWDENDFDSMWIVTYTNGKPSVSKDREGISPVQACQ